MGILVPEELEFCEIGVFLWCCVFRAVFTEWVGYFCRKLYIKVSQRFFPPFCIIIAPFQNQTNGASLLPTYFFLQNPAHQGAGKTATWFTNAPYIMSQNSNNKGKDNGKKYASYNLSQNFQNKGNKNTQGKFVWKDLEFCH